MCAPGIKAGLDNHAVVELGGWVVWFSIPQNISGGICDVFSSVKLEI